MGNAWLSSERATHDAAMRAGTLSGRKMERGRDSEERPCGLMNADKYPVYIQNFIVSFSNINITVLPVKLVVFFAHLFCACLSLKAPLNSGLILKQ